MAAVLRLREDPGLTAGWGLTNEGPINPRRQQEAEQYLPKQEGRYPPAAGDITGSRRSRLHVGAIAGAKYRRRHRRSPRVKQSKRIDLISHSELRGPRRWNEID